MEKFGSVDNALDFAIKEEEAAFDFYTELAGKMEKAWMKKVFEDFAQEEKQHKEKLVGVKTGKQLMAVEGKITDLKIADYLVDVSPSADLNYQKALTLAMKKEKAAFKLYSDLAATADNEAVRDIFLGLAQEEAKHKLRFEVEYDEQFLTEN